MVNFNLDGHQLISESDSHFTIRRPSGHKFTIAKQGIDPETIKGIQQHFAAGGVAGQNTQPVQQAPLAPTPTQPTDWLTKSRALGYMPLSQQQLSYPNLGTTYLTNMPSGVAPAPNPSQGTIPGASAFGQGGGMGINPELSNVGSDVSGIRTNMAGMGSDISGIRGQLPGMASGIQSANATLPGITSGVQQANAAIPGITSGIQQANAAIPGITSGVQATQAALPPIASGVQQVSAALPPIASNLAATQANTQGLLTGQGQAQNSLNNLQGDTSQIKSNLGQVGGTLTDLNAFTHQMMADRAVYAGGGEVGGEGENQGNDIISLTKRALAKLGALVPGANKPRIESFESTIQPGEGGGENTTGVDWGNVLHPPQNQADKYAELQAPTSIGLQAPNAPQDLMPQSSPPSVPQNQVPSPPQVNPAVIQPPAAMAPAPQQAPQQQAAPVPGGGGGGGIGGLQGQILAGEKQAEAGMREKANIESRMAQELAPLQQTYNQQLAEVQQRAQQQYQEYTQKGDMLADQVANSKIDPNHFYGSMSTGQRIGTLIASALGGWAAGATNFRMQNPVIQQLDAAVQRDVDAQKVNIDIKRNLMTYYMQKGHSTLEAEQLTKADLMDSLTGQIRATAIKWGGPQAQAAADQMIGEYKQKSAMLRGQVANMQVDNALKSIQAQQAKMEMGWLRTKYGILSDAYRDFGGQPGAQQGATGAQLQQGQPGQPVDPGLVPVNKAQMIFGHRAIPVSNGMARIADSDKSAEELKTGKERLDNVMAQLSHPPGTSVGALAQYMSGTHFGDTAQQIRDWRETTVNSLADLPGDAGRTLAEKHKLWDNVVPSEREIAAQWLSGNMENRIKSLKDQVMTHWDNQVKVRTTDPKSAIAQLMLGIGGGK